MSRYKDRSKNTRRRVQTAPEHERVLGFHKPIQHFWNAKRHSKRTDFSFVGLWLNGLRVTIRHTIFNLFTKGCVWIHTLIVCAYFLESSDLYKQRLNLIIHPFFLHSWGHMFQALKLLICSDPFSECCCLNQCFQVSKRIAYISLNPKTSSQEQRVLHVRGCFLTLLFSCFFYHDDTCLIVLNIHILPC